MSTFRILSIQWIDVEDVEDVDAAVGRAADEYYSLELEEREALPSLVLAVDLDSLEDIHGEILAALDRVLGIEVN